MVEDDSLAILHKIVGIFGATTLKPNPYQMAGRLENI
jgi:hypothetical protein